VSALLAPAGVWGAHAPLDAHKQDIYGLLGQMLFSGEESLKPTAALSGGETARRGDGHLVPRAFPHPDYDAYPKRSGPSNVATPKGLGSRRQSHRDLRGTTVVEKP